MEDNYSNEYNEFEIKSYIKEIEKLDEEYRNSDKRKNNGWKIHSYVIRKIKIRQGVLNVKLTKYKKFINGRYKTYIFNDFYLLHNNFNKQIDANYINQITSEYLNGASYRQLENKYKVSRTTILNYIKNNINKVSAPYSNLKKYNNLKNGDVLYISVDDTYLKYKQGRNTVRKTKCRVANFWMRNKKGQMINTNHLILFYHSKYLIKTSIYASEINNVIYHFYKQNLKIIILGDGAKWIKKLANLLGAKNILCRFHLYAKLRVIFNNSTETKKDLISLYNDTGIHLRQTIYQYLHDYKIKEIVKLISQNYNLIFHYLGENKAKLLHNFSIYLNRNRLGILEIKDDNEIYNGNNAEPFISHLIKRKTKHSWSIYSINNVVNLILNDYAITNYPLYIKVNF
ncbi:Mbov_0401 family ICE element transposase-like protein [[Mycoplasma] anseris]|uniref:Transposase n=1 Tax=[Mycoplasma] anseris TaxID=92400 RepID=A0A2Z4NCX0_9BACT|nr:hypothetical protein [[Mycoplasma] anseris]AWX69424.1 hypothetical protein DP065_01485 [[Mycoplasma] anseris]